MFIAPTYELFEDAPADISHRALAGILPDDRDCLELSQNTQKAALADDARGVLLLADVLVGGGGARRSERLEEEGGEGGSEVSWESDVQS